MNNRNLQPDSEESDIILNLMRNEDYLSELYIIKEANTFTSNVTKLYGCTKDKMLNVIISKQELNLIEGEENILLDRIEMMIKLIEDNIILVENIWIEENSYQNSMNNKRYPSKNFKY